MVPSHGELEDMDLCGMQPSFRGKLSSARVWLLMFQFSTAFKRRKKDSLFKYTVEQSLFRNTIVIAFQVQTKLTFQGEFFAIFSTQVYIQICKHLYFSILSMLSTTLMTV